MIRAEVVVDAANVLVGVEVVAGVAEVVIRTKNVVETEVVIRVTNCSFYFFHWYRKEAIFTVMFQNKH